MPNNHLISSETDDVMLSPSSPSSKVPAQTVISACDPLHSEHNEVEVETEVWFNASLFTKESPECFDKEVVDAQPEEVVDGIFVLESIFSGSNWQQSRQRLSLVGVFVGFILTGSGNLVLQKLQTISMHKYPIFLNIFCCIAPIPVFFAYIIPAVKSGFIPHEHLLVPKKSFVTMGFLDGIAGTMQLFASFFVPGPLLVLLLQAAIPISMGLSKYFLQKKYVPWQYMGALVIGVGIAVVLKPLMGFSGDSGYVCIGSFDSCQGEHTRESCLTDHSKAGTHGCAWVESPQSDNQSFSFSSSAFFWSWVVILSCIPMTLSSIYKEASLGQVQIDPMYLNGWVQIFQAMFAAAFAIPMGLVSTPRVYPKDLPTHLWAGFKCYLGQGTDSTSEDGNICADSPLLVNLYMFVNLLYSTFLVLLLKFGSANIMFLASTAVVPLGNLAFALPFIPNPSTLRLQDIVGLIAIMLGLLLYGFGEKLAWRLRNCWERFPRHSGHGGEARADLVDESSISMEPLLSQGE